MPERLLTIAAFFLFFLHPLTGAENEPFSTDRTLFIRELQDFLNARQDPEISQVLTRLEEKINNQSFPETTFHEMVTLCNRMVDMKLKAKPYFISYIESICAWNVNCARKSTLDDWHLVYNRLLDELPKNQYAAYAKLLAFSRSFYEKGLLIESPRGATWYADPASHTVSWKEGQPVIVFAEVPLKALWNNQDFVIQHSSGEYYPLQATWRGTGGTVDWLSVDPTADISCELIAYEIDLTTNEYQASEAWLSYPAYFGENKIRGRFSDKLYHARTGAQSTYPRFRATEAEVEIKDLYKKVTYRGGFSLAGLKAEGVPTASKKACLEIRNDADEPVATMQGELVSLLREGSFSASNMSIEIDMGEEGTLSHPCVDIRYEPGKKMILRSNERSASKAPYYNSYHKVFVFSDQVAYDLGSGKLEINPKTTKTGGHGRRSYIESEAFYDQNLYNRIQNVATVHPLVILAGVAKQEGRRFQASLLAPKINSGFDEKSILRLLADLEQKGFLRYNPDSGEILVLDRTFHYVEAAAGKQDNDLMRFVSNHDQTNAVLNTETRTMELGGVEHFFLHPRPRVAVIPKNGKVALRKNRGTAFDGKVYAGFSVLEGENFLFDYDSNLLKAGRLATFDIYIPDGGTDESGQPTGKAIGSRIERTSGVLQVNDPGNRSGRTLHKEYPVMQTNAPSYVYYDKFNRQGSVYDRKNFYFELNPFTLPGLSLIDPKDLRFEGKLVSGGIFPVIEKTLVFQPHDQSLGFTGQTPPEGLKLHGRGVYTGDLYLSNEGLTGSGNMTWLTASTTAGDFVFTPEKTSATSRIFESDSDKSRNLPEIKGENARIAWLPLADTLYIDIKEKPFHLFEKGTHQVTGLLAYTPQGVSAKGALEWEEGKMISNTLEIGHHTVKAETTDLQIKSTDPSNAVLSADNLKGFLDYETQKGKFSPNQKDNFVSFPLNRYQTSINTFEWDLRNKQLVFSPSGPTKGLFNATAPAQDSLTFEGTAAIYDLSKSELIVNGVSEILIADARILPKEEKVTIAAGGIMLPLNGAHIDIAAHNNYHQIVDAMVEVESRNSFRADGAYKYKVAGKPQLIPMGNIRGMVLPNGKTVTVGETYVEENDSFYIDAMTRYSGRISLESTDPWLEFDGFAQLQIPLLKENEWAAVSFKGDYQNLRIAADRVKNRDGQRLTTGIFLDRGTGMNYSSIWMPLRYVKDRELFSVNGVVHYDSLQARIEFGNANKLDNPLAKGNMLTFNPETAEVKARGSFNICENAAETGLKVAGIATTGMEEHQLTDPTKAKTGLHAEFVTKFDLNLPKELLKIMQQDFSANTGDPEPVVYQNEKLYNTAIAEWADSKKDHTDVWTALTNKRIFKPSENNPGSFVLGEVKMTWNSELQSLVPTSSKIALTSIGGHGIHRYIQGLVEFHMPINDDDRIYLLLTAPNGHEYYFNYKKGILHAYSSNETFNKALEKMSVRERLIEVVKGEPYELQLTTGEFVGYFKRRLNNG